jgi:hypothetical protein
MGITTGEVGVVGLEIVSVEEALDMSFLSFFDGELFLLSFRVRS